MSRLPLLLCLALCPFAFSLAAEETGLRQAAKGLFHLGVAINADQSLGHSPRDAALIAENFDSLTPENSLKWEKVNPSPGIYDFSVTDAYVALGEKNKAFVIGHTLVWHQQTPKWVFQDDQGNDVSREVLAERLRMHIRTVMGRYKGRIQGWDVVNEAVSDDGKLRTDRPWYRILGEDALRIAFTTAHEVDPKAELYYNDYSLWEPAKQKTVLELLTRLKSEGIPIHGVGLQEHYMLSGPTPEMVDATFTAFVKAGFPIMVTELDISVLPRPDKYFGAEISRVLAQDPKLDPYRDGLPADVQAELARAYGAYFAVYRKHAKDLRRVTLWGLHDGQSWLNNWPIRGRTDHPLLFDRDGKPKAAVEAIRQALTK